MRLFVSRTGSRIAAGFLSLGLLFGHAPTPAGADDGEPSQPAVDKPAAENGDAEKKADEPVVTQGQVVIGNETIDYEATTGKLSLKDDTGKKLADVFFIAYTKPGVDPHTRPITFAFNGGPGSSSVWLHMGMLGPRRIAFPEDASSLKPPFKAIENSFSLLDTTDLVFIDPVSTGFSRPAEPDKKSQFHGYDEDVRSVGQFIYDYTSKYQRWLSPKYLLGESYGGIRAVGLTGYLQERYNYELNGIVIVSGVINFQTLRFGAGNDLAYVCFLPSYTATAWYHGKLDDDLQGKSVEEVVQEAEKFAGGAYAAALLKGDALPEKKKDAIADQYARLTGLSAEFVKRNHLRVSQGRFSKELMRDDGRTAGRFDSRYLGIDRDDAGESTEYDPSAAALFGPFTATINDYLRRDLNYSEDRVYEILTGNVQPWSYSRFEGRYVDATETLRKAMTANPALQVYIACGYYDLATPHYAMEYTVDHLMLNEALRDNIRFGYFEGGHMMYVHEPSLADLKTQLVEFYDTSDNVEE